MGEGELPRLTISLMGLKGEGGEPLTPVSRVARGEKFDGLSGIGLSGGDGEFLPTTSLMKLKVGEGEFFKPLGVR